MTTNGLSLSLTGYKRFIKQIRADLASGSDGFVIVQYAGLEIMIERKTQYVKRFKKGVLDYDLAKNKKIDETHYQNMGGEDDLVTANSLENALVNLGSSEIYETFRTSLRQVVLLVSESARSDVVYRCLQKILAGSTNPVKVRSFDLLSKNYGATRKANFIEAFQPLSADHYRRAVLNKDIQEGLRQLATALGPSVLG